ncbi:MAG: PKD domain-containing protein, partial [Bacteroidota bacterium]
MEILIRAFHVRRLAVAAILVLTCAALSDKVIAQTALFNASTTSGCEPLTVNFTNLSTNATSYYWMFGNGNTSTLAT